MTEAIEKPKALVLGGDRGRRRITDAEMFQMGWDNLVELQRRVEEAIAASPHLEVEIVTERPTNDVIVMWRPRQTQN